MRDIQPQYTNHNNSSLEEIDTSRHNFYSYFTFKSTQNYSIQNLYIKYLYYTVYVYVLLINLKVQSKGHFPFLWRLHFIT